MTEHVYSQLFYYSAVHAVLIHDYIDSYFTQKDSKSLQRILSLPASWDTKIAARATAPTNKEARQSKRAPSHLPLAITIMYA